MGISSLKKLAIKILARKRKGEKQSVEYTSIVLLTLPHCLAFLATFRAGFFFLFACFLFGGVELACFFGTQHVLNGMFYHKY